MNKIFRLFRVWTDDSKQLLDEKVLLDTVENRTKFVSSFIEISELLDDIDTKGFCDLKTNKLIINDYADWDNPQVYEFDVIKISDEIKEKETAFKESLKYLDFLEE